MTPRLTTLITAAAVALSGALATAAAGSDSVPGRKQTKPIALVGGTVYPMTGAPIEDAVVLMADGKIAAVGRAAEVRLSGDVERIDCAGKRIYPGLFDAADQVGLIEVEAVAVTVDTNETGAVNPNAQVHVSVNPDSELIPTTRANGVLLAHVLPGGGLVSGQAAVMMLDGWTWEEMTLQAPTGIRLNWPNMLPRQASFFSQTPPEQQLRQRDEALRRIEDLFDDAQRYKLALDAAGVETAATAAVAEAGKQGANVPPYDAKLEAMVPLLTGQTPLLVVANETSQIEAAVAFARRRGLKLVIVGGRDAGKCAPLLAASDVPVILQGTHSLPSARDEAYDEAYTLPERLRAAGVRFCIAGNREPAFVRNLPYHVATAVAYGLPEEEALKSMTLYPAQILGVADRVGSLVQGKDATLIVCDGDILEAPTHVTHAWIQGRPVDLTSKHTRLYEKYKQRYGQE